jgi:hypothetical protein
MRIYFIIMCVLAAIAAFPPIQLLLLPLFIALRTIGAGKLIEEFAKASVISTTLLLYSILLLPGLWLKRRKLNRVMCGLASIVAVALVGFGLPMVSEHELASFIAEKRALRIDRWSPIKPRSIAFVSDGSFETGKATRQGTPRAICGTSCQGLLYRHDVEKVIETFLPIDGGAAVTTAYRVEARPICDAVADDQGRWLYPAVISRIAAGECLIASDSEDAELVDATIIEAGAFDWSVSRDENLTGLSRPRQFGWAIDRLHVTAVYSGGLRTGRLMLRVYEIKGWHYAAPLRFVAEKGECFICGAEFATETEELDDDDGGLATILSQRFGYGRGIKGLD